MSLHEEIEEIVEEVIKEEIDKIPPIEFPEVQKVEVINFPEPLELPEPVDLSGLEKAFKQILESRKEQVSPPELKRMENLLDGILNKVDPDMPDNSEVLGAILRAVNESKPIPVDFTELSDELRAMVDEVKQVKSIPRGGGAIGPSKLKITRAKDGTVINPAIAIGDGDEASLETSLKKGDPQATPIAGLDADDKFRMVTIGGTNKNALRTIDENSALSKEILLELKVNNLYLSKIIGEELSEEDIE